MCTTCDACVDACDRDAIVPRAQPVPAASKPTSVAGVAKVAVGSRAEAKALKKAARAAERAAGKPATAPTATSDSGGVVGWTSIDVLAILVIMMVALLAKSVVLRIGAVELMPITARAVTRAAVLGLYYAVQIAAFGYIARRHGSELFAAFGLRGHDTEGGAVVRSATVSAVWVGVLFIGTELVSIGYGLAMQAWGWESPSRASSDVTAVFGSGGLGLLLSAVLVAIAAPLVEEIAFRGVVLPVWSRALGPWGGILASAAVYAAFHFSLWLLLPTFVLGIALGWLLVRAAAWFLPSRSMCSITPPRSQRRSPSRGRDLGLKLRAAHPRAVVVLGYDVLRAICAPVCPRHARAENPHTSARPHERTSACPSPRVRSATSRCSRDWH